MDDVKLKEYMKLKIKIKSLEDEAKELVPEIIDSMQADDLDKILVPEIIDSMQADDLDKINSTMGSLSLSDRKVYTFSEKVTDAEKNIKSLKSEEIADGTATAESIPMLKFTIKKG